MFSRRLEMNKTDTLQPDCSQFIENTIWMFGMRRNEYNLHLSEFIKVNKPEENQIRDTLRKSEELLVQEEMVNNMKVLLHFNYEQSLIQP